MEAQMSRSGGELMSALNRALLLIMAGLALFAGGATPGGAEDKPAPRLKLIFAERFRFETWDNAINLDDASPEGFAYTRNKTTLGLQWLPAKGLEITGKLTNEFRVYFAPKDRPFSWNEVLFDNLYFKWKLPRGLPFTLTAGRQDIFLGEGFVIADGNPLDGSRSFYFNALRLDYEARPNHRFIFILHSIDKTDTFLPTIHDQDQLLVEQPEKALAAYYSGQFGKTLLDAYLIRKYVDRTEAADVASGINTLGARIQIPVFRPLLLTFEGAVQGGTYGDADRGALGGIFHLDCSIGNAVPFLRTLVLGGIFLSGDRPETEKLEAWDPLFSRWPKWSEGYIYTFIRESRVAYWSNLTSLYGSAVLEFGNRANCTLTCHLLGVDESNPAAFPGGSGTGRGTLLVGRLNFTISQYLSGHVQWDNFQPGDFYWDGASGFNWLRFELMFRY
jgi:hypothetical protein